MFFHPGYQEYAGDYSVAYEEQVLEAFHAMRALFILHDFERRGAFVLKINVRGLDTKQNAWYCQENEAIEELSDPHTYIWCFLGFIEVAERYIGHL